MEVGRGWLGSLLEAARAHPEAGLFTGTLLFRDEEVVNSTGLELDRLGRARDRDFRLPLARLARRDGPVAGVSGGAALIRCSLLREIGLFDPAYFAYYEDVDLSLRARTAGLGSWSARTIATLLFTFLSARSAATRTRSDACESNRSVSGGQSSRSRIVIIVSARSKTSSDSW